MVRTERLQLPVSALEKSTKSSNTKAVGAGWERLNSEESFPKKKKKWVKTKMEMTRRRETASPRSVTEESTSTTLQFESWVHVTPTILILIQPPSPTAFNAEEDHSQVRHGLHSDFRLLFSI